MFNQAGHIIKVPGTVALEQDDSSDCCQKLRRQKHQGSSPVTCRDKELFSVHYIYMSMHNHIVVQKGSLHKKFYFTLNAFTVNTD